MGSILPRPQRDYRGIEDDEHLCPLERLPPGLLWDIMEYAPQHVFRLRMASLLLQCRVDQYVRHSRNIPVVQQIKFSRADKSSLLGVVMYFNHKYALFKLRLLLQQPNDVISRLHRLRTGFFKLKFNVRSADLEVLDLISRYTGRHMDMVVIDDHCDDVDVLRAIWTFVKAKAFSSLVLVSANLTDDAVFFASKIIEHNSIEHFTLIVEKVDSSLGRPAWSLKRLSSGLRTLYVYQNDVTGIATTEAYLLGLQNANWTPTIRSIFAGSVDTLYIKSNYRVLTNPHCISLALHLPRTKKPLYFAASYSESEGLPGDKDYVTDYTTIRGGKAVRIAHSSRENYKVHDLI